MTTELSVRPRTYHVADVLQHTKEDTSGTCTEFSARKERETLFPLGRVKRIVIRLPS